MMPPSELHAVVLSSDWTLAEECEFVMPLPDKFRPYFQILCISGSVIIEDPSLSPGERWVRIHQGASPSVPLFLVARIESTPPKDRFYVPTATGTGFRVVEPLYAGHWRTSADEDSELPWPIPEPGWTDKEAFLQQLDDADERADRVAYRGISNCRLCGQANGHEGLRLGQWEWPAGFRHYIADHEVRPDRGFEAFIASDSGHTR